MFKAEFADLSGLLFEKVFNLFPYPLEVFAPDGTAVLLNAALLREMYLSVNPQDVIGKYNLLKDPYIAPEMTVFVKRAFAGEKVFVAGVKAPIEETAAYYGISDLDLEALYQDITLFPIKTPENQTERVVSLLVNKRIYSHKEEIINAKKYVQANLDKPFSAKAVAEAVFLSIPHLSRLFKKHTGKTLKEYYSACKSKPSCEYQGERTKSGPEEAKASAYEKPAGAHDGVYAEIIDNFPYPIQVFQLDGSPVYVNQAAVELIGLSDLAAHFGAYKVFSDPLVVAQDVGGDIMNVRKGETVYITNFNAAYRELKKYFKMLDRDVESLESDITCFPLFAKNEMPDFFACVFFMRLNYSNQSDISKAMQYIETHWREPFDSDRVARGANLSPTHFRRLFKKHTGTTPHDYYIRHKTEKIKDRLADKNLSVAQAFDKCGVTYNGYSAKVFKALTGLTPTEFRNSAK